MSGCQFCQTVNAKLDLILLRLSKLQKEEDTEMEKLDALLKEMADQSTQIDGLSSMIAGIRDSLATALANVNIPAAVQDKIDAVFDAAEANKAKLATALNVGTPAANVDPAARV